MLLEGVVEVGEAIRPIKIQKAHLSKEPPTVKNLIPNLFKWFLKRLLNFLGTITSTGPEQPSDSSIWRSAAKRSLSGLQCIFCGIGFPDQTLYFLHKGCHSDANPWKCNICGEQCSNVYEFNSHLLSKSHQ